MIKSLCRSKRVCLDSSGFVSADDRSEAENTKILRKCFQYFLVCRTYVVCFLLYKEYTTSWVKRRRLTFVQLVCFVFWNPSGLLECLVVLHYLWFFSLVFLFLWFPIKKPIVPHGCAAFMTRVQRI